MFRCLLLTKILHLVVCSRSRQPSSIFLLTSILQPVQQHRGHRGRHAWQPGPMERQARFCTPPDTSESCCLSVEFQDCRVVERSKSPPPSPTTALGKSLRLRLACHNATPLTEEYPVTRVQQPGGCRHGDMRHHLESRARGCA